jgi:GR25 family glycosyltransferase involved in LPS biosynthesis
MSPSLGYYINLERSKGRDASMRAHLDLRGLLDSYERFPAVDGAAVYEEYDTPLSPGALGCWLSHLEILKRSAGRDKHLHIMEDDTVIHERFFEILFASGQLDQNANWDLMFTDTFCLPTYKGFRALNTLCSHAKSSGAVSFVELDRQNFNFFISTSSYIVNKASIGKYATLLGEGWKKKAAIDNYTSDLILRGELKAYITVPFVSTLSPESMTSTISELGHTPSIGSTRLHMMSLHRMGYYLGADVKALLGQLRDVQHGFEPSDLQRLWTEYLSYHVSMLSELDRRIRVGEPLND